MMRSAVVFGTRPEIIKLAPVVRELAGLRGVGADSGVSSSEVAGTADDDGSGDHGGRSPVLIHTGQHLDLARPMLEVFGLRPDHELAVMTADQELATLSARLLDGLRPILRPGAFDLVWVQGDTTTAMIAALAAFYARIPVAHVEAGLRTGDKARPFPEEVNRRLVSVLADLHFAPTELAAERLRGEGVPPEAVQVTGNSVVDALMWAIQLPHRLADPGLARQIAAGGRWLLVTAHRREHFGAPHARVFAALRRLLERFPDLSVLVPVHPNPNVREQVRQALGGLPRVTLTEPLGYLDFLHAMKHCTLILSDSGGVQEEAPSLGKPVLVLRDATERPEGIAAGWLELVGTDPDRIVAVANRLLVDGSLRDRFASVPNPYGDGRAAARMVTHARAWLARRSR